MARTFDPGRGPMFRDRWKSWAVLGGILLMSLSILRPPQWRIQQLQSPDGAYQAELRRVTYTRPHFRVYVKTGLLNHPVYTSPAITNAPSVDLRERLIWHPRDPEVFLAMQGKLVWGYQVERGRFLGPEALSAVQSELADQIPR